MVSYSSEATRCICALSGETKKWVDQKQYDKEEAQAE